MTDAAFYELSLSPHVKGPKCVDLGPEQPSCPGCGMGYVAEAASLWRGCCRTRRGTAHLAQCPVNSIATDPLASQ